MLFVLLRVTLVLAIASGCKHRDPLYCDEQTACAAGYAACDLTAACTELRNTCLPPEDVCWDAGPAGGGDAGIDGTVQVCDPDTFIRCDESGDVVACNTGGTAETVLPCDSGCSEGAMGCNDCVPDGSVCESDILTLCSSTGAVLSSDPCALGCHDEVRCNDLATSNGLDDYLDDAATGPDLVLVDGSSINTKTGAVLNGGTPISVPSDLVDAPAGGVPIRVLKVKSFRAGDVDVTGGELGGPALAIVSNGDVEILGDLRLLAVDASNWNPPGAFTGAAGCNGTDMDSDLGSAGGGGAGHGDVGGNGGAAGGTTGRAGGTQAGSVGVVPLRGGCKGGTFSNFGTTTITYAIGGRGGGAIQISSRTRIVIGDGAQAGSIQANGLGGLYGVVGGGGAGGGSGGGVLLEAPVVSVGPASGMSANGGGGSCGTLNGNNGTFSTSSAPLVNCAGDYGDGGWGGSLEQDAGNGTNGSGSSPRGGGGGGAVGRVRINTADGTYTFDGTSIRSPEPDTAAVDVR